MLIKIIDKRLKQEMFSPATPGSAGIDLHACIDEDINLLPGETVLIPAGFAVHMNNISIAAQILPRSGLGTKKGLVLGNSVGLIDSDYQGEINIAAWNRTGNSLAGGQPVIIKPMQKIAQMVFVHIMHPEKKFVEEFDSETERGTGGFGSTGLTDNQIRDFISQTK